MVKVCQNQKRKKQKEDNANDKKDDLKTRHLNILRIEMKTAVDS